MESSHFAEAVYLLVDGQIAAEMTYDDFETHIERQTELPGAPPTATVCRACYLSIGPELRILGLVFFLLQVDARGRPDRNFNVPLPYLAKNAGPGPDLGYGPVPMACRGSCSVPWHANNLWDPTQSDVANPMDALVLAVASNRLQFDPQPLNQAAEVELAVDDPKALIEEMSVQHTRALMVLQDQHEAELAALREVSDAKLELYRQEVERLRAQLAQLQVPISGSRGAVSSSD